jgi:hypothetical protein
MSGRLSFWRFGQLNISDAKRILEENGYTVLKTKSYNQARERQRVAEDLQKSAEARYNHLFDWMERDVFTRESYLVDSCTFLYGKAIEHGA